MKKWTVAAAILVVVLGATWGCLSKDSGPRTPASLDGAVSVDDATGRPDVDRPPSDGGTDGASFGDATDASDANPTDARPPPVCIDAGPSPDGGCLAALPLFNTGVDGTGAALAGGSVDPHYSLIQSAEATLPGPAAIVTSQIADGYWVPQSATAKWIAPSANQSYPGATPCNASGTYVYRTTFSLAGYDHTTAQITGRWGADNSGTAVRLNGVSLGITAAGYAPLTAFTINAGFVAGTNSLEFELADIGCPNGLRVEMSGTAVVAQ